MLIIFGQDAVETMPIAVYTAAESDLESAIVLSVVLLAVSFAIFLSPHRTFNIRGKESPGF